MADYLESSLSRASAPLLKVNKNQKEKIASTVFYGKVWICRMTMFSCHLVNLDLNISRLGLGFKKKKL